MFLLNFGKSAIIEKAAKYLLSTILLSMTIAIQASNTDAENKVWTMSLICSKMLKFTPPTPEDVVGTNPSTNLHICSRKCLLDSLRILH